MKYGIRDFRARFCCGFLIFDPRTVNSSKFSHSSSTAARSNGKGRRSETQPESALRNLKKMHSPQEQARRHLAGGLDSTIASGLLRPSVVSFEDDEETDSKTTRDSLPGSYLDASTGQQASDQTEAEEEEGEETWRRNKILRRFNDYVQPNTPLHRQRVLLRQRVDILKKEAKKQWRDRPRRCSHNIELII